MSASSALSGKLADPTMMVSVGAFDPPELSNGLPPLEPPHAARASVVANAAPTRPALVRFIDLSCRGVYL